MNHKPVLHTYFITSIQMPISTLPLRVSRVIVILLVALVISAGAYALSSGTLGSSTRAATATMSLRGGSGPQSAVAFAPSGPVIDTTATGQVGQRYIVTPIQAGAMSATQLRRLALRVVEDEDRGQVLYLYTRALRGSFAAILTAEGADELRADGRYSVVPDERMRAMSEVQRNPPSWGLDRFDGQMDTSYAYNSDGAGVHIYVMDTGVRMSHGDLAGRADKFMDLIAADGSDPNGHGSHVAGTAAGTVYGLGKRAQIHSVRVLDDDGNGYWTDAIEAIDSLIAYAQKPAVLNMSLAGPTYPKVDSAVQRAVRSGITVVVAAGNSADDACNWSPAREPVAITVGATTKSDGLWTSSNHGRCIDILAPGEGIASIGHEADDRIDVLMNGTSMASPHVAGAAALYLQRHTRATPAQVAAWLVSGAGSDEITNVPEGTPNLMARIRPE